MVGDEESGSPCNSKSRIECDFSAIEGLAEYAQAANLTRADELLADLLALMVSRSSAVHKAD